MTDNRKHNVPADAPAVSLDPASLAELKREVAKIPPQTGLRAEAARLQLIGAIHRLERTNDEA